MASTAVRQLAVLDCLDQEQEGSRLSQQSSCPSLKWFIGTEGRRCEECRVWLESVSMK